MDFNGTYAKDRWVLPHIAKQTVEGGGLTAPEYEILKRDLPDIEAWRVLRPMNPSAEHKSYHPSEVSRVLNTTLGFSLPERPRHSPNLAWKRLAPYIGYDETILEQIGGYYRARNQEEQFASKLERAIWKYDINDDNIKFIRPFKVIPEEQDALIARAALGDEFVFPTGLMQYSESDFINHLDAAGTWKAVKNNNPPGFFREGRSKRDTGVLFYKCMAYKLMDQVVKARNEQYRRLGIDTTLVLKGMDDHARFVKTIVRILDDIEMHMPISEKEAQSQGEVDLIGELAGKTPNSDIKYSSFLAKAA